jgi:nicotinamide riboside transporter PnuC
MADRSPDSFRPMRALAGVVLALAGSLTLTALVFMTNSSAPVWERLMFDLGLALTGLISAIAQTLVLYGLWLLWTARRGG